MPHADPSLTEALTTHLEETGFADDLGSSERWVTTRFGPLVVCLPNLAVRKKAMFHHDLNHVVSGYGHDLLGESEVSAWEIGGGCGSYAAAWVLAWSIILPGALLSPRRVFRAFVRGRRTGNLFTEDIEQLLDLPLSHVRTRLGLDREYRSRLVDVAGFAGVLLLSPVVGLIPGITALVTSPLWIRERAYRQRRVVGGGSG